MFHIRAFALCLTAALALSTTHGRAAEPVRQVILAEGHALAWKSYGSGRPVLVMTSGLGNGMETFEKVAPKLAEHGTVIIYDRPGYGGSPGVQSPRDAEAAARDLNALLEGSGVKGPYIVLGHSLGGLYAEAFAERYPDKVAGLVLEEARPSTFTAQCQAALGKACDMPKFLEVVMPAGARKEIASLQAVDAQVQAMPRLTAKPVLVLSRPTNDKPMDRLWGQAQSDLAASYAGSRHMTAPGGGHYIHVDQQAWFLQAVTDFMDRVGP